MESSKVNSNEIKISKLNSAWNNYNRRLKWIDDNELNKIVSKWNQVTWMVGFDITWMKEKQIDLIE